VILVKACGILAFLHIDKKGNYMQYSLQSQKTGHDITHQDRRTGNVAILSITFVLFCLFFLCFFDRKREREK
jgi:hypothetical protein